MKVLLANQSGMEGKRSRNDVISDLLKSTRSRVEEWSPTRNLADASDCLILAHSSTRSRSELNTDLRKWAKAGATVVLYSGGEAAVEQDDSIDKGQLLTISWELVREALSRLDPGCDLSSFHQALHAVRMRNVLDAFSIIAWCVTFPSGKKSIEKRQAKWLSDPGQWVRVFGTIKRDDFLTACGVEKDSKLPKDLEAVEGVLDWLWPPARGAVAILDIGKAFEQIKVKFSIYCDHMGNPKS